MREEEVKSKILDGYKALGGCAEIFRELSRCDNMDELVDIYVKHPTWCMELGFPKLSDIRSHFCDFEHKGVFVDMDFHGETITGQVAIFHNCTGYINVEMDYRNAVIPMLYFCNGCEIHVECNQRNAPAIKVPMHIYGDNFITTDGKGNAVFNRHEK